MKRHCDEWPTNSIFAKGYLNCTYLPVPVLTLILMLGGPEKLIHKLVKFVQITPELSPKIFIIHHNICQQ